LVINDNSFESLGYGSRHAQKESSIGIGINDNRCDELFIDGARGPITLRGNEIRERLVLEGKFDDRVALHANRIGELLSVSNAEFSKGLTIAEGLLKADVLFQSAVLKGTLVVDDLRLERGCDLRMIDFTADSLITFDRLRGRTELIKMDIKQFDKVKLFWAKEAGLPKAQVLAYWHGVYEMLATSFENRGQRGSADEMRHGLELTKHDIEPSLRGWFMKWCFGFGYEPWRWIVFVMAPAAIAGGALLHFRYRKIVNEIYVRKLNVQSEEQLPSGILAEAIRSGLFGVELLFSIRFNHAWMTKNRAYNRMVVSVYLAGIMLYVLMILGARSSWIDSLRSLIGL
jgi:hypothetical protein